MNRFRNHHPSMTGQQCHCILTFALASVSYASGAEPVSLNGVDAFSSPDGKCTDACVALLNPAWSSIYIQADGFMPAPFERALVSAGKRGVKIKVTSEVSQSSGSITDASQIAKAVIPAPAQPTTRNNTMIVIVVDGVAVITGSLNTSLSKAEKNVESMLIIRDPNLAACYLEGWTDQKVHPAACSGRK